MPRAAPAPLPSPPNRAGGLGWVTILAGCLLIVVLLGAALRDYLAPAAADGGPPAEQLDPVPRIAIRLHDAKKDDELERLWLTDPQPTRRFGVVTLHNGKEVGQGVALQRLTFDPWGRTNNACLRFDHTDERLFGGARGRWQQSAVPNWTDERGTHDGVKSVWVCEDKKVEVTQFVEMVRGEQSRLLDTCRVRYQIENRDSKEYTVGIRFLLDTYIGGNDGVPFTIPGENELCDTLKDLPAQAKDKKVPDFLQALEKPDLAHPGTVAHLRLKLEEAEPPVRVTLGAWPNEKLRVLVRKNADGPSTLWDVPLLSMKSLDLNDSAIVLYWPEQPLKPGQKRDVGFEYGLWDLASEGSRLAVTVDGVFRPEGELTVVAYVNTGGSDHEDETVTLTLPDGFRLLQGTDTQLVPQQRRDAKTGNRPITWKVRAGSVGKYQLTVKTGSGSSKSIPVEIKSPSIF